MPRKEVSFEIIGWVKNNIFQEISKDQWKEAASEIIIESEFKADLKGINHYPYLLIVFWMDRAKPVERKQGSLATCFPERPNPIGVTIVRLLELKNNILKVMGLDAFDGTPILDIKPYKPWSLKRIKYTLPDINMEKPEGDA